MVSLLRWRSIACCIAVFVQLALAAEVVVLGNDPRLTFSAIGNWDYSPDLCSPGFLAETIHGASATLIFRGTPVLVKLLKVMNGALASVYLDGAPLATNIDLIDPTAQSYQCVTQDVISGALGDTYHNVTLVHSGRSTNAVSGQADWMVLIEISYTTSDVASSSSTTSSSVTSASSSANQRTTGAPAQTSSTTSSKSNSSAMIGGIVGAVLGGILLGAGVAWYCLQKRRPPVETTPQIQHGMTQVVIEQSHTDLNAVQYNPYAPYAPPVGTPSSTSDPSTVSYVPPPPQYDYKRAPQMANPDQR